MGIKRWLYKTIKGLYNNWYVEFAIRQKEKELREQHIMPISEAYMLLKENMKQEKKANND